MQIQMTDLGPVSRIALEGRLDTPGVGEIETRFTAGAVASGKNAIIDLSSVTFISSMGIRLLITAARALALRKARMVLYGLQPAVRQTLEYAALQDILPVAADESQALAVLGSA